MPAVLARKIISYLYVLPVLIVISLLILFPTFWSIWMSLHVKTAGGEAIFAGLRNFKELLSSGIFISSVIKTIIFTFTAVFFKLIIGMAAALILNRNFRGRNLIRSWLFIPWTIPLFSVGLLFLWLFRMSGGMNIMLSEAGLPPIFWLGPDNAMLSVIISNIWKGFPFFMIGILAGLQVIPKELYEAAAIDGASGLQQFRYITLPCLRDVILIVCILSTLWTFAQFDIIFVLTGGGPGTTTETLPLLVYKTAFGRYNIAMGYAIAVLSLPLFLFFIFWLVRLVRKEAMA